MISIVERLPQGGEYPIRTGHLMIRVPLQGLKSKLSQEFKWMEGGGEGGDWCLNWIGSIILIRIYFPGKRFQKMDYKVKKCKMNPKYRTYLL